MEGQGPGAGGPGALVRRRQSTSGGAPSGVQLPVAVLRGTTVRGLLEALAAQLKLSLFRATYELRLTEADQAVLRTPSRSLGPDVLAESLLRRGVTQVGLRRRAFQDAPGVPAASAAITATRAAEAVAEALGQGKRGSRASTGAGAAHGGAGSSGVEGGSGAGSGKGSGADSGGVGGVRAAGEDGGEEEEERELAFDIVTASRFQEWRVLKVNAFGRRQERLLGLDLLRVTNEKDPSKSRMGSSSTRNRERLVTQIARVIVPDPPAAAARALLEARARAAA